MISASACGAVQESQRNAGKGRVEQRALSLDQIPTIVLARRSQPLDRTRDEIGDHRVDRNAIARDQDAGLPGCTEVGGHAARVERTGQCQRAVHLADRAIRADGQQAPPGARIAIAHDQPRRHVADVEQLQPAFGRERSQPRLVAQTLVHPRRDIHSGVKGRGGVSDKLLAEFAAGAGDAEHQRASTGCSGLDHRHPRQAERERAGVVAEFAEAVVAPEFGEAARRLDVGRLGAAAEIKEKWGRDH